MEWDPLWIFIDEGVDPVMTIDCEISVINTWLLFEQAVYLTPLIPDINGVANGLFGWVS
jgi:hypothetical protein